MLFSQPCCRWLPPFPLSGRVWCHHTVSLSPCFSQGFVWFRVLYWDGCEGLHFTRFTHHWALHILDLAPNFLLSFEHFLDWGTGPLLWPIWAPAPTKPSPFCGALNECVTSPLIAGVISIGLHCECFKSAPLQHCCCGSDSLSSS